MKTNKMQSIYQQYQNHVIQPDTQQMLNKPLENAALDKGHEEFLKLLVGKLEKGELNPYMPATLFNEPVFKKLSEEEQEKADMGAINLMGIIRQIQNLWKLDHKQSFQLQNLVETVWQMKSKLEEKYGDVYVI